ncbi:MAG TPA: pyridoxamine 5'-phosphate oxidase [Chloroflexota bacterium]|nr:pyridoxamine 5'-phosphate oxidase [Chloroflexota bacterium]
MTELSEVDLDSDPIRQFSKWLADAVAAGIAAPEAMTVATATREGLPSARMVLLKGVDQRGFVFFTNFDSQKGRELAENPRAALVFYWPALARQVRVVGTVAVVPDDESDRYFHSRPRDSQISAVASWQSSVISDRAFLEKRYRQVEASYSGVEIPRPSYWGGFRVAPESIEFWQSRLSRLHDRLRYFRQSDDSWIVERLSP